MLILVFLRKYVVKLVVLGKYSGILFFFKGFGVFSGCRIYIVGCSRKWYLIFWFYDLFVLVEMLFFWF